MRSGEGMGVEGSRHRGAEWEARPGSVRVRLALKMCSLVEVASGKDYGVHILNDRAILEVDLLLVDALDLCDDTDPLGPLEVCVVDISSVLVSIAERLIDRASAVRIAVVKHGEFSCNVGS